MLKKLFQKTKKKKVYLLIFTQFNANKYLNLTINPICSTSQATTRRINRAHHSINSLKPKKMKKKNVIDPPPRGAGQSHELRVLLRRLPVNSVSQVRHCSSVSITERHCPTIPQDFMYSEQTAS